MTKYYIILSIIVILFHSHIFWLIGRIFNKCWWFPLRICIIVHENLQIWFDNAKKHFKNDSSIHYSSFSMKSVITLLLYLLIIGMNILLIAQVLEVFFFSDRIRIPYLGSYASIALLLGILYALSETVLSLIREDIKSRQARFWLFVGIAFMILTESGLAYYRGWVLSLGQETQSPTLIDDIMSKAGGPLAALIAFFVATSQTLLGWWRFHRYYEGKTKRPNKVKGAIKVIGCGIAFSLWGWHPIEPKKKKLIDIPPQLTEIQEASEKLKVKVEELDENIQDLLIIKKQEVITDFREDYELFKNNLDKKENTFTDILEKYQIVENKKYTYDNIKKNIRELKYEKLEIDNDTMQLNREFDALQNKINSEKNNYGITVQEIQSFNNNLHKYNSKRDEYIIQQKNYMEDIKFQDETHKAAYVDISQVRQTDDWMKIQQLINRIKTSLETIKIKLDSIQKSLESMKKIDLPSYPEEDMENLKQNLVNLSERLRSFERNWNKVKNILNQYELLKRRLIFRLFWPGNWGKVNVVSFKTYSDNSDISQVENTNQLKRR